MRLIDGDEYAKEMKRRQDAVSASIENPIADRYYTDKEHWEGVLLAFAEAKLTMDNMPTVDAVAIKAISVWLAAYAAPPRYAIDEIAGTDPDRILTVDTLVRAWEYHWKYLMACGLLQEEPNGTDNP
jgi:hypothetical protein